MAAGYEDNFLESFIKKGKEYGGAVASREGLSISQEKRYNSIFECQRELSSNRRRINSGAKNEREQLKAEEVEIKCTSRVLGKTKTC